MNKFEQLKEGIFRLKIPFDNIYTSVFLLHNKEGTILVDSASSDNDAKEFILPALKEINVIPNYIICSHLHSDHSGGINELLRSFENTTVGLIDKSIVFKNKILHLNDGDILLNQYMILNLKGHTDDSIGILDLNTKALLSFDSLQQNGVGKYKTLVADKSEYINSINRLVKMDINTVICSHDYDPYGCMIEGKENILRLYKICEETVNDK